MFSAVLSNVLNTALYPSSADRPRRAPTSCLAIYERALRYLMILSLPIACGAWALAGPLVAFLLGGPTCPPSRRCRSSSGHPDVRLEFLGYVVVIQGQERRVACAVLVSTALNVGLNLILVPRSASSAPP